MAKSNGLQQFEHLNDKSTLFLYMLEEEAKDLEVLRASVEELRREQIGIRHANSELGSRITSLEEKRAEMDKKAGVLLKFLDDVPM